MRIYLPVVLALVVELLTGGSTFSQEIAGDPESEAAEAQKNLQIQQIMSAYTQQGLANGGVSYGSPDEIVFERHAQHVLQKKIRSGFVEMPLTEVVAYLQKQIELPIVLDRRALEDAGVGDDTPITCHLDNLPAEDILSLMMERIGAVCIPHKNTLLITTPEKAGSELVVRVYPVADLTLNSSIDAVTGRAIYEYDFDSLLELIMTTVQPTTWDQVGGPGSAAPIQSAGALALSQTVEVHKQVEDLLTALRIVRDRQGLGEFNAIGRVQLSPGQPMLFGIPGNYPFQPTQPAMSGVSEQAADQVDQEVDDYPLQTEPSAHVESWQMPTLHE